MLVSIGTQVFCTALFAWSTAVSVPAAAVARLIGGMANGSVPVSKTYVSEITAPEYQGRALAIVMSSWQIGLMVGPALGG